MRALKIALTIDSNIADSSAVQSGDRCDKPLHVDQYVPRPVNKTPAFAYVFLEQFFPHRSRARSENKLLKNSFVRALGSFAQFCQANIMQTMCGLMILFDSLTNLTDNLTVTIFRPIPYLNLR